MAPQPPPSQAGRFKPRKKPAKKIRVGEAASGGTVGGEGTTAPSAAATAASSNRGGAESSGRGGRGGRAGGGGGRGGRLGGRGGRVPQPVAQGQAFFEATPQPVGSSSSSRKSNANAGPSSSGASGPSSGASNRTAASRAGARSGTAGAPGIGEGQEEIIGILEEGVGASAAAAQLEGKKSGSRAGSNADPEGGGSGPSSARKSRASDKAATSASGIYYDDDSSDDGDGAEDFAAPSSGRPQHATADRLLPMALPEPHIRVARPDKVESYGGTDDEDTDNPLLALASKLRRATIGGTDVSQQGPTDDWLLVQLPTRLPPLKQRVVPPEAVSSGGGGGGVVPSAVGSATNPAPFVWPARDGGGAISTDDPVSVPSVRADRFDHDALRNAQSGRLGRLVVYKSGAMHLLLEGPDGAPTIRMNVTGRECGLVQQAVSIDTNSEKLVMLGNVQHSLVVTPDLTVD